jgi:LmbE family N-acetylglucosaminyl deacetylase
MTEMYRLSLRAPAPLSLLVIGAHADDIEIGAGATILRLLAEHPGSSILWVVASSTPVRAAEARASAAAFSAAAASVEVMVSDFPDGRLPSVSMAIKDVFESIKSRPFDLILAPHHDDAHQDHRLMADIVSQTFRHHLVAGYEIPKWDGDFGRPNLFVDIDEATLRRKIELLEEHFPSQHDQVWWGADTFLALPRLRGIESATRYAEGFFCRKVVL